VKRCWRGRLRPTVLALAEWFGLGWSGPHRARMLSMVLLAVAMRVKPIALSSVRRTGAARAAHPGAATEPVLASVSDDPLRAGPQLGLVALLERARLDHLDGDGVPV